MKVADSEVAKAGVKFSAPDIHAFRKTFSNPPGLKKP
jgi:hypothetical protein